MTAAELHTGHALYRSMLRDGEGLVDNERAGPELRMALLCDHAPQQYAKLVAAAVFETGFFPRLFTGDYGATSLLAFDPGSELYAFRPEVAVYSTAVQKYRDRFFGCAGAAERERLAQTYLEEILAVSDALNRAGVVVVLNSFPLPVERMFGNFSLMTAQSLYGSVVEFNALLAKAVASRPDCVVNDLMYLSAQLGAAQFLDERLWHASKYPCSNAVLPAVARGAARLVAARKGRITKVLVLDLDNTLWGGVIGDDGLEGIGLGGDAYGEAFQQFQRYILALRDRGYVLAVCSKNNEPVVLDAFRNHPEMVIRETDISVMVANWNDKASNIEYIARVLNLGLDSMVFVDDSPFERSLVRAALPQVAVPEMPEDVADYCSALEASGLFEAVGFTAEDAARNAKYCEEAVRTSEQLRFGNIGDYLASLDMRSHCGPVRPDDLPGVVQLFQRSNQFNLRTQRLSRTAMESLIDSGQMTVAARLRDRFGDYGLISAIACDTIGSDLQIVELVMSCRVLKRGVEEFLMNYLFEQCRRRGLAGIRGQYIRSSKNDMVSEFYARFGFARVSVDQGQSEWYLAAKEYRPRPTHIEGIAA